MNLRQTLAAASPTNDAVEPANSSDPMTSYYSSLSLAKSRISLLSTIISSSSIQSLSDSDSPALSLLNSPDAYVSVSLSLLSSSSSISPLCNWLYDTFLSSDPHLRLVVLSFIPVLTNLYLTLLHSSPNKSLAGFEAVLLALYNDEVKTRAGKPVIVNVPDLSRPSVYHTPKEGNSGLKTTAKMQGLLAGVVSLPLEPQTAVKSTKRACIVGVVLDCYFKGVSRMPFWSKLDFCRFVAEWAGQDCCCKDEFDRVPGQEAIVREMRRLGIGENGERLEIREAGGLQNGQNGGNGEIRETGRLRNGENGKIREAGRLRNGENGENGEIREAGRLRNGENGENGEIREMGSLRNGQNEGNGEMGSLRNGVIGENGTSNGVIGENGISSGTKGVRIPLPWEILQPVLRILGHCLLAPLNVVEVKEAAGVAVRCLYARASHDLVPQAILATRSLIQLDKRAREAERAAVVACASSKVNTPSKSKRPEMLLVSK